MNKKKEKVDVLRFRLPVGLLGKPPTPTTIYNMV